jgi:hypothetical protein
MNNSNATATTSPYITVTPDDIVAEPYPHALKQGILRQDFFDELLASFPPDQYFDNRPTWMGARTGRDFYQGDSGFDKFIQNTPAWKELHSYINSTEFVDYTLALFGPYLKEFGCRLDPAQAKLVDYQESRTSTWIRARLARWLGGGRATNPNDLFMRFDIEQSDRGYKKPVHCDNPSRVASFLVYFCDADKLGLQGGDLRIHEHIEKKAPSDYERHPKESDTRVVLTIRPKENLGAFFLCSNNSYHSVTEMKAADAYRKFIYLNVSSKAQNLW